MEYYVTWCGKETSIVTVGRIKKGDISNRTKAIEKTKRSDRNITNKKEEYGKKRIEERWQPGKNWP